MSKTFSIICVKTEKKEHSAFSSNLSTIMDQEPSDLLSVESSCSILEGRISRFKKVMLHLNFAYSFGIFVENEKKRIFSIFRLHKFETKSKLENL